MAESRRMLRYVASPHCPHPTVASTFTKPCCARSNIAHAHAHPRTRCSCAHLLHERIDLGLRGRADLPAAARRGATMIPACGLRLCRSYQGAVGSACTAQYSTSASREDRPWLEADLEVGDVAAAQVRRPACGVLSYAILPTVPEQRSAPCSAISSEPSMSIARKLYVVRFISATCVPTVDMDARLCACVLVCVCARAWVGPFA